VGQKLQEQTGQPFVVDNRPGAGGNLGAEAVARSMPDGHTLLIATTAHAINPALFSKLGYQLMRDFAPVSQLTSGPLVLVVNPQLPVSNVKELVALARDKRQGLSFASSGNGQSTHLAAELFCAMAGVHMTHVPYRGSAPALTDVMAGQADLMFDTMLSALAHIQAGKLKALAVTSSQRSPAMPGMPTIAESGLPGYEAIAWNGLLAPAGTPPAIIHRLGQELRTALDSAQVGQRLQAQGFAPAWSTPQDHGRFLQAEIRKWAIVVRDSGARLD
jgi:tripartite-type tricarboxylate transporter receptor subunit TctC